MKALFQNGLYRVHYIVSSQCWKKWQLLKELQFSKKLQCLKGWHSSKRCSVQGEEAISGVGGGVQGEEAISLFIHTFTQYCCLYLLNSKRSQWKLHVKFRTWMKRIDLFSLCWFFRHASWRSGDFPHDPAREAGHDVQRHLEQRNPARLPKVHARCNYTSSRSTTATTPPVSNRPRPSTTKRLKLEQEPFCSHIVKLERGSIEHNGLFISH